MDPLLAWIDDSHARTFAAGSAERISVDGAVILTTNSRSCSIKRRLEWLEANSGPNLLLAGDARRIFLMHGYQCVDGDLFRKKRASISLSSPLRSAAVRSAPRQKRRVLFIVDTPAWAHDNKTKALSAELRDGFEIETRYTGEVDLEDLERADLVVIYYWNQVGRLIEVGMTPEESRKKVLIGICSHWSMRGEFEAQGVETIRHWARAVFVNSRLLMREYGHRFGDEVFYTPNGVDVEYFARADDSSLRSRRRAVGEPLRVGWAGSLTNHGDKRGYHEVIVPAVAAVEGVELVTAAREERWRTRAEMRSFYHGLDVYLCASRSEGTPNPCLEAAAAGVPIISTPVGNMPELIEDGENGFLVERSVRALVSRLMLLRDQPEVLARMGRNVSQAIRQWAWSRQAQNYRRMFDALLPSDRVAGPSVQHPKRQPERQAERPAVEPKRPVSVFRPGSVSPDDPLLLDGRRLRVLYLCPRRTFEEKMSRVRFHGIHALGKVADLTWSGPGWPGWREDRTAQSNIDAIYGRGAPDLIIAYQADAMRALHETQAPRCLRYNEMYDRAKTLGEIERASPDLVVCHHRNDYEEYLSLFAKRPGRRPRLVNIPHCAERTIYHPKASKKSIDLLLVGHTSVRSILGDHYPLRQRFIGILQKLAGRYRCAVHKHPGYRLADASTDRNSHAYADAIRAAKICLTCSGLPRSRFGKYVEIPLSGTALAADLPGEDHAFFREFLITVDSSESDDEIIEKLVYYLENDAERDALVERGIVLSSDFTQESYARWLLRAALDTLADGKESMG